MPGPSPLAVRPVELRRVGDLPFLEEARVLKPPPSSRARPIPEVQATRAEEHCGGQWKRLHVRREPVRQEPYESGLTDNPSRCTRYTGPHSSIVRAGTKAPVDSRIALYTRWGRRSVVHSGCWCRRLHATDSSKVVVDVKRNASEPVELGASVKNPVFRVSNVDLLPVGRYSGYHPLPPS